jgi:hypothetical protein
MKKDLREILLAQFVQSVRKRLKEQELSEHALAMMRREERLEEDLAE